MMMIRIVYFFSFKKNIQYESKDIMLRGNFYRLLQHLYVLFFVKSKLLSFLDIINNKLKSHISEVYNNVYILNHMISINVFLKEYGIKINNKYIKGLILNFSNKFYNYLNVSKIVYLEDVTILQYISSYNGFSFIKSFDKFLNVIEWDINEAVSYDKLYNIYNINAFVEDIVSEDIMLLNNNIGDTLINSKYSVSKESSDWLIYGTITNFFFKNYYNSLYNNPDLINDSKTYYYSFSNLYKFYNVDIFRTSFLFFENVRHSTKLEIVWTIVPTAVLVLIAMHHLRYCILMTSL